MSYHEKLKEDADREEDTGEEPVLLRGAPIADDMLRKIKEKVSPDGAVNNSVRAKCMRIVI